MGNGELSSIPEPTRTSYRRLISRCEKANIEYKVNPDMPLLEIRLPCGREKREVTIFEAEDAQKFAKVEFEKYVFIRGYESICCYADGYLEAYIKLLYPSLISRPISLLFSKLLNIPVPEIRKIEKDKLVFKVQHQVAEGNPVTITISHPTNTMLLLTGRELMAEPGLTVKISGLRVSTNQDASNILEKLANALFLQLETAMRFSLMLETYYERPPIPFSAKITRRRKPEKPAITFPKYEYHRDPLNLYWYAKSAHEMPLLQFLAYYQVLEFYFPTYAEKDAIRTVANIVKDPAFNPDEANRVGKIVTAVLSKTGRGYGEEKQQLRATIQECVEEKDIREFLEERNSIKEHFKSNYKKLSLKKIDIANKDSDIRDQITERIYDLRCKIVHTKAGEIESERILPFTEEESLLPTEIGIIEFIARKAIIAGSSKLSI